MIVSDPPCGVRVGDGDPGEPIAELGDFLKERRQGSTAYLYFGDRELVENQPASFLKFKDSRFSDFLEPKSSDSKAKILFIKTKTLVTFQFLPNGRKLKNKLNH
ncbi:MAG: hypothetical protein ACLFRG_07640 [Desulfococcaceae bacterium]